MQWLLLLLLLVLGATVVVLITEYRRRRSIEARSRAILSSSVSAVAVLDCQGVVEDVNDRWTDTCDANPFTAAKRGEPWLPDPLAAVPENPAGIARVRDALMAVLDGREAERTIECDWRAPGGHGSSQLRLRRIERREGGAIVSHVDVTASRRVEDEAQKALHELAHMNMRGGLGELVSAVTHELTQS